MQAADRLLAFTPSLGKQLAVGVYDLVVLVCSMLLVLVPGRK